jgi:hypothetical protein
MSIRNSTETKKVNLKMQKRNVLGILAVLLVGTSMMFSQTVGSGNPHLQGSLAVPVTGQFTAPTSGLPSSITSLGSGVLSGVFNITSFAVQNVAGTPTLVAVGNLVGTLTNAAGTVTTVVLNNVTAPITAATASCPILSLTLGPLNLNVLGLVVNIPNPINVNIIAQSGPGNLLGNLLCSVSNLLNGGGPLSQVTGLLNQILGALGL